VSFLRRTHAMYSCTCVHVDHLPIRLFPSLKKSVSQHFPFWKKEETSVKYTYLNWLWLPVNAAFLGIARQTDLINVAASVHLHLRRSIFCKQCLPNQTNRKLQTASFCFKQTTCKMKRQFERKTTTLQLQFTCTCKVHAGLPKVF